MSNLDTGKIRPFYPGQAGLRSVSQNNHNISCCLLFEIVFMQNHTLSCRNTILLLGAIQAYGIQGLTGLKGGEVGCQSRF